MLFMVIEHFAYAPAVYERFREEGRMMPDGVRFVASWTEASLGRTWQVMECDDITLLQEWVARWCDIAEFEIVPVAAGSDTSEALARAASDDLD
jgi:hypothetical protein